MDAVTSAPSRVRQASGRGRGADTARWTRARFPSSSLGLRALLSSSPSGARSLDRRFGPVSRRRLPNEPKSGRGRISALARVGPGCPATPGPSQPPRRDGAWPQHEVIIGAADGQNNSSILTCLKTDSFLLALKQTLDSVQSCKFGKFKIMSIDRQGIIYN